MTLGGIPNLVLMSNVQTSLQGSLEACVRDWELKFKLFCFPNLYLVHQLFSKYLLRPVFPEPLSS